MDKERVSLVKQDGNFLEYPTYTLHKKGTIKEIIIETKNGTYHISTHNNKLPNRLDRVLFYYVLNHVWKNNFNTRELRTNRYRVAKDVFGSNIGKFDYERLMKGLERWENMSVKFEGIFYEGDNYTTRLFGFFDDVVLDDRTNELIIRVNEQIIEQIKHTKYYRLVDWKKFKKFRRDVSARLYEIFQIRSLPWKIEATKLAEKLTIIEKYPSHIIKKVIPAINEINSKTNLNIKFNQYKNDEGSIIFVFTSEKIEEEQKSDEKIESISDSTFINLSQYPLFAKLNPQFLEGVCKKFKNEQVEKILDILQWQYSQSTRLIKSPEKLLYSSLCDTNFIPPDNYIPLKERIIKERKRKVQVEAEGETRKKQEREERELEEKINNVLSFMSQKERKALRNRAYQEAKEEVGEEGFNFLPDVLTDIKEKQIIREEYLSEISP